ncbi:MAG: glycosyltransferase family 39 protein [Elusimicrobiota bacterium]
MERPPRTSPFEAGPEPTLSRPVARKGGGPRWALAGSLLCLAALFAVFGRELSEWGRLQDRPPAWDQSVQLETALDLRDALAHGRLRDFLRQKPKPGMPPFPPLYHLSIQPFGGGADANRALWANWLHLGLLMLALWGIGYRLSGPWRALAGALLFACTPVVQEMLRTQLIDLPLTAWVAAAWWAFLSAEDFARLAPSLLFAVACAAAMLTKWSAFSYLLPAAALALPALTEPRARRNLLLSAALFLALVLPWYLDQWPTLIPRLFEASADGAIPLSRPGALFVYPSMLMEGFNLPLLLLGLIAVFVPTAAKNAKDKGPLLAWLAFSVVFWTVVPNRQLRFLLPGLAPFAIFCATLWPRWLLGALCAVQLLIAANYPRGFLPRMSLEGPVPVEVFTRWKPYAEDWKLRDILRTAAAARDASRPGANVVVVGNHPFFNCPTFTWVLRREGLRTLAVRGVNRRLCEFAEFVVLKTGSLGPDAVTGQLPAVRDFMLSPAGWFGSGWRELRRFPLPDGSEAVLFQQRRFARPPLAEKVLRFDYFEEGSVSARDLRVELGDFDPARGLYPRVRVRAEELVVRGLLVRDFDAVLEGLVLIPAAEAGSDSRTVRMGTNGLPLDVRFLRLDRLSLLRAAVGADALAAFISERSRGAGPVQADIEGGLLQAAFRVRNAVVSAAVRAALAPDGRSVSFALERLSVAGIPVPTALLGRHARFTRSFAPDPELPFELSLAGLRLDGGRLLIGNPR